MSSQFGVIVENDRFSKLAKDPALTPAFPDERGPLVRSRVWNSGIARLGRGISHSDERKCTANRRTVPVYYDITRNDVQQNGRADMDRIKVQRYDTSASQRQA